MCWFCKSKIWVLGSGKAAACGGSEFIMSYTFKSYKTLDGADYGE
jgi:hypothetical protein